MTNTPSWATPVVLCCKIDHEWLLTALGVASLSAGVGGELEEATSEARVLALRDIVAAVPLPYESRNAEVYGEAVLALLASPKAALFGAPELLAIVRHVVAQARARCAVLAATLGTVSESAEEVTL
jgi:hypothetical protein